jgi:thiosulfate dehydrogenase
MSARASLVLVALALAAGGCRRGPASSAEPEPAAAPARVPLRVPGDETIPEGPRGDLVRRGRTIATRTSEELPAIVGSDLHCTSCHLEAGTRANAGPWVGLSSLYPQYRARAGRTVTLEDRIDECFERSMNGKPLAHDSPEMQSLVAYIDWLSEGVPRGAEVIGRGFAKLERPPMIDPDNGRNAYDARCASCHGADGQGRRADDGSYQFPPLWGDRTFNLGAGMARLDTAAAFVRHNMPLGQGDSLTATESYDIAAYFTEQPRADFAGKWADWPRGGKPRDARY